jgi:hypothetical protein
VVAPSSPQAVHHRKLFPDHRPPPPIHLVVAPYIDLLSFYLLVILPIVSLAKWAWALSTATTLSLHLSYRTNQFAYSEIDTHLHWAILVLLDTTSDLR